MEMSFFDLMARWVGEKSREPMAEPVRPMNLTGQAVAVFQS